MMNKVYILRIMLILAGILGVSNTVITASLSKPNLGIFLPLIIGVPLLLMGMLYNLFDNPTGRVLKLTFFLMYGLAAAAFIITGLLIRHKAYQTHDEKADVIIVLGAGIRGSSPTLVLRNRLDTALQYMEQNPQAVVILSGGVGANEEYSEAYVMASYLERRGVNPSRLTLEESSTSTRENFYYSYEIIKQRFDTNVNIAFVTTDFHVLRAGLTAKKLGIEAYGLPAPDIWYIHANNYLRECVAIWAYTIVGNI